MSRRLLTAAVFAAMMFLIPLLALEEAGAKMQQEDIKTASFAPEQDNPPEKGAGGRPAAAQADAGAGYRILDSGTGRIFTVSAQEFVRGALAAEMPPTFHPEALKAQAVAAHTYAESLRRTRAGEAYDLAADPENWRGYTTEAFFRERYGARAAVYWKAVCAAADEVNSYLLVYEGEPIVAAYHSMSSGTTEDAANVWTGKKPYLVPVESRGDKLAPDYETVERFTAEEVKQALMAAFPQIGLGKDPAGWLSIERRSEGGYAVEVRAGDMRVKGTELRAALGLRSSCFEVAQQEGEFTFTVRGYGHGVGLSQYGADFMARQGAAFDEILLHYYPGTALM